MNLSEKLKKVNEEIYSKFGTESYEIRCKLFDIHKELESQEKKLHKHIVSQQRESLLAYMEFIEQPHHDGSFTHEEFIEKFLSQ